MKITNFKLLLIAVLFFSINTIKAQDATLFFEIAPKTGENIDNPKTVNADQTDVFFLIITHLPDLSKYDMVTVSLGVDHKAGGFFKMTGEDFMASTKNSTKVAGMKYITLIVVNSDGDKGNDFYIDEFAPYETLNGAYLFSKEGNKNKDSYVMEAVLYVQNITSYDEKWDNGVLKKTPIYGDYIRIGEPVQVNVETSSNVAAKAPRKDVNSTNSLLDAINAGNKKVDELR